MRKIFPGLSRVTLQRGSHASLEEGLNAMEATAWLAGEPHTDAPFSVAPSFRWLILLLNDHAPDAPRQRLKEVLAYLIGTSTYGDEAQRIEAIGHWAKQHGLPLESGPGLREAANQLDDAAGRAEAKAVETSEQANAAAARSGTESVAAHAAAYQAAGDAYAQSGEVHDAASIAAGSMRGSTHARQRAERDAASAADEATAARSNASDAMKSAGDEDERWRKIVDSAIILIRRLAEER